MLETSERKNNLRGTSLRTIMHRNQLVLIMMETMILKMNL